MRIKATITAQGREPASGGQKRETTPPPCHFGLILRTCIEPHEKYHNVVIMPKLHIIVSLISFPCFFFCKRFCCYFFSFERAWSFCVFAAL